MATLYALGHEDHLRAEGAIPAEEADSDVEGFFQEWTQQPARSDLPDKPEFHNESSLSFRSYVLGCEVIIESRNDPSSIQLAEVILGSLEAFLATAPADRIIPHKPELVVKIKSSAFSAQIPEFKLSGPYEDPHFEVLHPTPLRLSPPKDNEAFQKWLLEFLASLVAHIAIIPEPEKYFERFARDEAGVERALSLSGAPVALANILGEKRKMTLSDWDQVGGPDRYPLQRDVAWDARLKKSKEKAADRTIRAGQGDPPPELFGVDSLKHKHMRVLSLIDIRLWDKAGWKATYYLWSPDPGVTPGLALA